MKKPPVFISHSSQDDPFVTQLRQLLNDRGITVWDDAQKLRGGDYLKPEILQAIEEARGFIAVLSPDGVDSKWVTDEIQHALKVQADKAGAYPVIPLLFPKVSMNLARFLFPEEPLFIKASNEPGGLEEALPHLLTALGEQLPEDLAVPEALPETPVDELLLLLESPTLYTEEGKRRGQATAQLLYQPAQGQKVESKRYPFIAPLGPIEAEDLRWYLEHYPRYPFETLEKRAQEVAAKVPVWGQQLYDALAQGAKSAEKVLGYWKNSNTAGHRFTIKLDGEPLEGASAEEKTAALEAGSILLSLPWEILHDGRGFLFQGRRPARVRRRLPNREPRPALPLQPLLRILLLSPRPEAAGIGYIDHRVSARALLEAVEQLGPLATLKILEQPTFPALVAELRAAEQRNEPYTVVHFDGHGVFDRLRGLGALCFESPEAAEQAQIGRRKADIVDAKRLAAELRGYRIPLFFLDACQTAMQELDPAASVATTLLENGVASVAAMSHSVLVETARRFALAFYPALAQGARIGSAMLAGQQALHADPIRAHLAGGRQLKLQDWFVPVLYQEEQDLQVVKRRPSAAALMVAQQGWAARLGELPPEPPHSFVGRSRELLQLERILRQGRWAVVRGTGGAGKTTIAAELARWLLRTGRFERVAFISFEFAGDTRSALDALGRQLLPEEKEWSVAKYESEAEAFQPIERALRGRRTLLLLDNMESILPDAQGVLPLGVAPVEDFLAFFQKLLQPSSHTQLLFTTRERLPAPFDAGRQEAQLGALSRFDALELVAQVMRRENVPLPAEDFQTKEDYFGELAEAANRHARALTLLAGELARGVAAGRTNLRRLTQDLQGIMAELDRKHPGSRENSLFASLELSLRRLPADKREKVEALAVFHGGTQLWVWSQVVECPPEELTPVAEALVEVGLAERMQYGYYRLDPALPAYLTRQAEAAPLAAHRARWAQGMEQMAGFLYQQQDKDAYLSARLTRLLEPNLLALLAGMAKQAPPERVVDLTNKLERLFSLLHRPAALALAKGIREQAARQLGAWSHARFTSESATVDRLLEQGNLPAAYQKAVEVLEQCRQAGEVAYPGAAYDGAMAHFSLGRVLKMAGQSEQALPLLEEAQRRFGLLAEEGNKTAERMAAVCWTEMGDCYRGLGRLEAAAEVYEKFIEASEKEERWRDVAVDKGQLATVRLLQEQYDEALALYREVKDIFEQLGETGSVATAWELMGTAHKNAGQYEMSERAYHESLGIRIQQQNREGEAGTLNQLGLLYGNMNRLEDSVRMHKQAADIFAELQNQRNEGFARNNLAIRLIKLRRYPEARGEIKRAIECKAQFGHAAAPWKSWDILFDLETADGHPAAAAEARDKAMAAYRAFRVQGGGSQSNRYRYFTAAYQAIQEGTVEALAQQLLSTLEEDDPVDYQAFVRQLVAVLRGARGQAVVADGELYYMDAVELGLLLEQLGG